MAFGLWITVDVLFISRFDNVADGGRALEKGYDFIIGEIAIQP